MQNQVLALQEKVDPDTMICDAERVRDRYRHGPQNRTPWYETCAPSTRTTNNYDDQLWRRDEPVPDNVFPKADDTMQKRCLRGKVLMYRKQGREPDGVGVAKQRTPKFLGRKADSKLM